MSKNPGLRPGEIKILKALAKGSKSNKQLRAGTKLNKNCLSDYLKRLQKIGLVERDIDTRIYHVTEDFSEETLFVNDIAQLIQSQVDKTISEKNSFSFDVGFCTVENNSKFLKQLETAFAKPENSEVLKEINKLVLNAWRDFVLSSASFNENERKIIGQIDQMAKELHDMTRGQIIAKVKETPYHQDCAVALALSDTEKKRYDEILLFFGDKKNQKIREKCFNKTSDPPKSLLVFTPLGFSAMDYEERIEKLFPETNKNCEAEGV
jgi:DNA-binding HxlR family transcriptional regulator